MVVDLTSPICRIFLLMKFLYSVSVSVGLLAHMTCSSEPSVNQVVVLPGDEEFDFADVFEQKLVAEASDESVTDPRINLDLLAYWGSPYVALREGFDYMQHVREVIRGATLYLGKSPRGMDILAALDDFITKASDPLDAHLERSPFPALVANPSILRKGRAVTRYEPYESLLTVAYMLYPLNSSGALGLGKPDIDAREMVAVEVLENAMSAVADFAWVQEYCRVEPSLATETPDFWGVDLPANMQTMKVLTALENAVPDRREMIREFINHVKEVRSIVGTNIDIHDIISRVVQEVSNFVDGHLTLEVLFTHLTSANQDLREERSFLNTVHL